MSGGDRPAQFDQFISTYQRVANANGLRWDIPVGPDGAVSKDVRWDIGEITGTPKPPAFYLSDFGRDPSTLAILNAERASLGASLINDGAISPEWRELLKALTVRALFEKRNSAKHIRHGILRPIRALATCCYEKEPWELNSEDVGTALSILGKADKNAKLQSLVEALLIILDDNGLSAFCPLLGQRSKRLNARKRMPEIRTKLEERRRADRLPRAREFWEMLRILLEERPTSFYDMVRFGAVELGILMGLRVEEIATIPVKPVSVKKYVDVRGQSAAVRGGIGQTMFIRHFSEKQGLRSARSVIYAETSTSILRMFEDEVQTVLDRVEQATAPLRQRLKEQITTGRIFPEYALDEMVPLTEIYPRISGNPFVFYGPKNNHLAKKYRRTLDPKVLLEIRSYQARLQSQGAPYSGAFTLYMARSGNSWIPRRDIATSELRPASNASRPRYGSLGVLISEFEQAIKINLPTKLSDTEGFPLEGQRELAVHECLFLAPKRALNEARGDTVCDVTRYAFVGRLTSQDITEALGKESVAGQSFFAKYGKPEAASYTLNSHAMRHMHNNELFVAGVADTIITHRFGRKSVAQSHEYDSRTLAQELTDMELPPGTADLLIGPARDAFKLIASNRSSGRVVDEFRRIQKEEGDEAAVVYLAAEADGMQITPYGLCLNSFVVEPCPRHLECFGGCSHLMRTGLPGETTQLQKLAGRYQAVLASIDKHPGSDAAKSKAKAQATARLAAIEQAIATKAGDFVFPNGEDLSRPFKEVRMSGLIE
ncbi:conserved hypothetical protein [Hyphomicrobiales bacterium]|jgi:hypothetical protein|nr:conserved hypothetical protein [Hyphomicrobiales bacterium]CAH1688414.1 conserved hypothetical protein [Hyphomicrobiales bacterium]CAH1701683.1 conserved hypothetical protein [Hyphomicrobiales bacterium]CAI0347208.1 conserved hypothetical protein [Hyphomicrobiales bacterium]